jgi:hypothetical protein
MYSQDNQFIIYMVKKYHLLVEDHIKLITEKNNLIQMLRNKGINPEQFGYKEDYETILKLNKRLEKIQKLINLNQE